MKPVNKTVHNPFGVSRVDNPFQRHSDLTTIYQSEFSALKGILLEIQKDGNHQSRGAVVIGRPGSGKTHLAMRLAKEVLAGNRLLFIRQPNNPESILYHIYSRILESLVEKVPKSPYSQIEYLLAQSFSKIIISAIMAKKKQSKKDEDILELLSTNPLNIYKKFGAEGSATKRRNWKYIENKTLKWWSSQYGFGGYAGLIVKGLIKFCSYSDPYKRGLVQKWLAADQIAPEEVAGIGLDNWQQDLSKEDFSLEAIMVFGRLSIEDQPLIIIFDQLEGLKYNENLMFRFGQIIKELFTQVPNSLIMFNLFPDRWDDWQTLYDQAIVERIAQYKIFLKPLLPEEMTSLIEFRAGQADVDLHDIFTEDEIETISRQNSIRKGLNCASDYFRFKVDKIPLPEKAVDFEERVAAELDLLKQEIAALKTYLNIKSLTLEDVKEGEKAGSYFKKQKILQEKAYQKQNMIISSSDDLGKLMVIFDVIGEQFGFSTGRLKFGQRKLPEHFLIKGKSFSTVVGFLQENGTAFTSRIKNFNTLVKKYPKSVFKLMRDQRKPLVKAKIAMQEIEKLKTASNGDFIIMDRNDRIMFETLYKMVVDILNKEFTIELRPALEALKTRSNPPLLAEIFRFFD